MSYPVFTHQGLAPGKRHTPPALPSGHTVRRALAHRSPTQLHLPVGEAAMLLSQLCNEALTHAPPSSTDGPGTAGQTQ